MLTSSYFYLCNSVQLFYLYNQYIYYIYILYLYITDEREKNKNYIYTVYIILIARVRVQYGKIFYEHAKYFHEPKASENVA